MAGQNYAKNQLSPEQQNALREQTIINARILALKEARKLMYAPNHHGEKTTDELIASAAKIENYLIGNIDALKPKSSLVVTAQMPPAGAGFEPGK